MTLSAAQRTSLETAKDNLITAMATHTAGDPFTASYTIGGRSKTVKSVTEALDVIERIDKILDQATAGHPSTRVSYGRHRRFR